VLIPNPRRISIVGSTGSGKTHLARRLAARLALPLHELDEMRADAAQTANPSAEFIGLVTNIVAGDSWIVDGHYRDVRSMIWHRADTIVWLNYSPFVIASRLLRRFAAKKSGHAIGGAGNGANASWSRRLGRISRTFRERQEYGDLLRSPEYRSATLVELKSDAATEKWLACLGG
jgi:adenylate kinase family enzyme